MSADEADPISTPRSSRTSRTTRKSSQQKSSSSTNADRKDSLPESPHIYDISEICLATNYFLAKRFSSSFSASWRCTIRGRDVVVFQRKFRSSIESSQLLGRLALICRIHHVSIIELLGVSISGGIICLVYEHVNGANLRDCLRNPNFTVLSTWISRMQIATDLAHGLDYIHNFTSLHLSLVHNHIESSSVIVTEPSFNAKICHVGTAALCGEVTEDHRQQRLGEITEITGITEEASSSSPSSSPFKSQKLKRMDSGKMKFEGTIGHMPPEFQSNGIATQKTDVYAFGIVILELLSGEEPLKFRFDKASGEYLRISVAERAKEAINGGGGNGDEEEERRGRLRRWVDRRLRDSYPVEVAEKMTRIALECVDVDPDKRPDMGRVAGKISKLYLESMNWSNKMRIPTDFTVSLAPR